MDFLIITGLSGAGKSRAADVLEDLGYYCADNIPLELMPRFAEFCTASEGRYEKVALVTDVREKGGVDKLPGTLEALKEKGCPCRILFMEADTETLVRRYKETRRRHPLREKGMSIEQAIEKERELMAPMRERADYLVSSDHLTLGMLQNRLFTLFAGAGQKREIDVTVMSFGFKHGLPMDADLVMDARFLPNPFYVDELRDLNGLDKPVFDFVFGYPQTKAFMEKLEEMVDFLLPHYIEEGKQSLTIAIGCTGGHHRSVAIASALNDYLTAKGVSSVNIHRDIEK